MRREGKLQAAPPPLFLFLRVRSKVAQSLAGPPGDRSVRNSFSICAQKVDCYFVGRVKAGNNISLQDWTHEINVKIKLERDE